MTLETKIQSVAAIENGTVIDHISSGKAVLLLRLLRLDKHDKPVTLGLNLPSSRMKIKDIIKVEGRELSSEETSQVAIFSPMTTLSIIQDYQVVKKFTVRMPDRIAHVIVCPNPHCITQTETTSRLFYVANERKEIQLRCAYCERCYHHHEINRYVI